MTLSPRNCEIFLLNEKIVMKGLAESRLGGE